MKRLLLLLAFVLAFTGCGLFKAPKTARETARGIEAGVAMGVQLTLHLCAVQARSMRDAGDPKWEPLATKCSAAYKFAVLGLNEADAIVDAWEQAAAGRLACALGRATAAMRIMLDELQAFGLKIDPDIKKTLEDAVALAAVALEMAGASAAMCSATAPLETDGGK